MPGFQFYATSFFLVIINASLTEAQELGACTYGDSLVKTQDYFSAIDAYENCFKADTSNMTILSGMAKCQYILGDYQVAKLYYHRLEQDSLFKTEAISYLASIYEGQQNIAKAIKYNLALSKVYPSNPTYLRKLGMLYLAGRETTQSILSFESAISLNPRDLLAIQSLSELYINLDQNAKADSLLTEGLKIDSMHIGMSLLQSRLKYRLKDYGQCASILNKLTFQTDLNNYYNKLLGYSYLQIDSLDLSIQYLTKSLVDENNPEYAFYYLGLAFEKKKLWDEAIYFYHEASKVAISENITQYHKGLARIYTHTNKNKEVIFHYKEALRFGADKTTYFYLGNAAERYYKNKKTAITFYQKFVEAKPDDQSMKDIALERIRALKEYEFFNK